MRNLYAGQEATFRTEHGTDWFQIGKGVGQDYILSPCLFNLNAECIMQNPGLDEAQAGFRKGRGTRVQIANIRWIIEKARKFQKTSTSVLLTMPKPLIVWITTNCGKFLKRWEYQST